MMQFSHIPKSELSFTGVSLTLTLSESSFMELLEAEEAEDEAVLKERLSTWSLDRLQEEGYCLTGMSAYWLQANQFGRPVASFLLGPGINLPENRLEYVLTLLSLILVV